MDVLILCGGLGARLRAVVRDVPKPMAEIHGKPFLDFLIDRVRTFGFRRILLCAGFQGEVIQNHYKHPSAGLEVVVAVENEPLGTAGAVKNAEPLIRSNAFLAMNGDSYCDVDLAQLILFHQEQQAVATLALAEVRDAGDFGSVILGEDRAIVKFSEKTDTPEPGLVNAGIYVFNRSVLDKIPAGRKTSLEYDVFPRLIGRGLYGFATDRPLFDIGTPERLATARKHLN
jgi:NDP-sugar pyrophosphorylase family protein